MSSCPQCNRNVTVVHGRESSRAPTARDIVVCLGCGAICWFDAALRLHVLTPAVARTYDQLLVMEAIAFSDSIIAGKIRH